MVARLAGAYELCPKHEPVSQFAVMDNRDIEFCFEYFHTHHGGDLLSGIFTAKDVAMEPLGSVD